MTTEEDSVEHLETQVENLARTLDCRDREIDSLQATVDELRRERAAQTAAAMRQSAEAEECQQQLRETRRRLKVSVQGGAIDDGGGATGRRTLLQDQHDDHQQLLTATQQLREQQEELQVELDATRCRARVMLLQQAGELCEAQTAVLKLRSRMRELIRRLEGQLPPEDEEQEYTALTPRCHGDESDSVLAEPLEYTYAETPARPPGGVIFPSFVSSVLVAADDAAGQVTENRPIAEPRSDNAAGQVTEDRPIAEPRSDDVAVNGKVAIPSVAEETKGALASVERLEEVLRKLEAARKAALTTARNEKAVLLSKQRVYEQRVRYVNEDVRALERRADRLHAELLSRMDELRAKNDALAYANARIRDMSDAFPPLTTLQHENEAMCSQVALLSSEKQSLQKSMEWLLSGWETSAGDDGGSGMPVKEVVFLKTQLLELQSKLEGKEGLLQELKSKAQKKMKTLEENWKKAENEVYRLDELVEQILQVMLSLPTIVESSPELTELLAMLQRTECSMQSDM
ncbi:PREDICTED: sperm-associated antigen 5-like [Priapulus caudatus]|uniref:Sperm-associated antigen 5-like n=1 Tax=Priapulus caudatus TaxID=37621 RepID=A0ABM1EV00_PRICU|nr:PREDICTED: sperm-associated antigen 5-like [Priapulus caudatus]